MSVEVSKLVARWQEAQQTGQTLSLADLCVDCPEQLPELRRRLEAIRAMESFLGVSVEGNLEASLSATLTGTIGMTAAGQISPGSNLGLTLKGDAGLAVELAAGYEGISLGGYAVFAGLGFQSQISVGPNGFSAPPPSTSPTIQAGWVGPDFDLQGLLNVFSAGGQRLSDAIANSGQQLSSALSGAKADENAIVSAWEQKLSKATQNTPFDLSTWNPSNW